MTTHSYYHFAGKKAKDDKASPQFHLLVYHSLDVAACSEALWQAKPQLQRAIVDTVAISEQTFARLSAFFACIHDVGKFSFVFQRDVLGYPLAPHTRKTGIRKRHDSIGYFFWRRWLLDHQSLSAEVNGLFDLLGGIATGHHGIPPEKGAAALGNFFTEEGVQACNAFIDWAWQQWHIDECIVELTAGEVDQQQWQLVSWLLSGMMVLADWLGSDENTHHYCVDEQSLADYLAAARPRASAQIQAVKLHEQPVPQSFDEKKLLSAIGGFQPTPLQQQCLTIALEATPQLLILEDITGSGKTEAAFILAARLLAAGKANGLYFGLPTMATADGLFSRIEQYYQHLYRESPKPSLVLTHSATQLARYNTNIKLPDALAEDVGEDTAGSWCNEFFRDNRKKALLADVGIGTIDQALLAILQSKHQSLRMLGLVDKVLVVDEVHSFDSYVNELICALITTHTLLGGTTVLLSATLSRKQRGQFVEAYAKAMQAVGRSVTIQLQRDDYPLLTQVSGDGVHEYAVPRSPERRRRVDINPIHTDEAALAVIRHAVADGRCVAWIRNTVNEAISSFEAVKTALDLPEAQVTLFHSRFIMADRLSVQRKVLGNFDKQSGAAQRRGQVVISTQVIEQSLDIDVDVMISDLAPIDLIIQRAGRLQRHRRDATGNLAEHASSDGRPAPVLHVLMPENSRSPDNDWFAAIAGTQYIYHNWATLWLTQQALLKKRAITMPDDARWYMQQVYDNPPTSKIPEAFEQQGIKALGKEYAGRARARTNHINLASGYRQHLGQMAWQEETPTRLSDATTTLVLASETAAGLQLLADKAMPHRWEMSSVKVRTTSLGDGGYTEDSKSIELLKTQHRKTNSDDQVVIMHATSDGGWQCEIGTKHNKRTLRYNKTFGLVIDK